MVQQLNVEEQNKGLVRRFVREVVNAGDYEVVDELFAAEYVRHDPTLPEEKRGPGGFKETVEMWRTAFPDVEMTIDAMVAEGDLVAFRATETGTHEGTFMGIEPTGKRVELTGNVMHRLEDGKLVETWASFDMLGLMEQLGAIELAR
ncbi:MAG: ester cyclase [Halalkalicoccus sp.]|nr:ester cyclase [Halalkalicoccus sp.]